MGELPATRGITARAGFLQGGYRAGIASLLSPFPVVFRDCSEKLADGSLRERISTPVTNIAPIATIASTKPDATPTPRGNRRVY
jgi:hypothetical protein